MIECNTIVDAYGNGINSTACFPRFPNLIDN